MQCPQPSISSITIISISFSVWTIKKSCCLVVPYTHNRNTSVLYVCNAHNLLFLPQLIFPLVFEFGIYKKSCCRMLSSYTQPKYNRSLSMQCTQPSIPFSTIISIGIWVWTIYKNSVAICISDTQNWNAGKYCWGHASSLYICNAHDVLIPPWAIT